jgi:erythromycin esterase-like protein
MPYTLPPQASQALLTLAARSDVLLLGELHGTQEVPQLVTGLLDKLTRLGYCGLALEVPANFRDDLAAWAERKTAEPPRFFTIPPEDGRNNEQVLHMVTQAVRQGWQILCFDLDGARQAYRGWQQRDADMARNFTAQRDRFCSGKKVIGICGNLHSRLTRASGGGPLADNWPSFASFVQRLNPEDVVSAVNVVPHQGVFFNGGKVNRFNREPIAEAYVRDEKESGHSLVLHLPRATPATFLTPPRP